MMFFRGASLLILLVPALVPVGSTAQQADPFAAFRQVLPSVVRIRVEGVTEGGRGVDNRGTGFFVSEEGHILTAFHVVGKDSPNGAPVRWSFGRDGRAQVRITVETWTENETLASTSAQVSMIEQNERADLALLLMAGSGYPAVACDVKRQQPGQPIRGIGWRPGLNVFDPLLGIIAPGDPAIAGERYRIVGAAQPGHSGGPVFDDDGEVIGVITSGEGGRLAPVGETYAIPIERARSLLPVSSRAGGQRLAKRQGYSRRPLIRR